MERGCEQGDVFIIAYAYPERSTKAAGFTAARTSLYHLSPFHGDTLSKPVVAIWKRLLLESLSEDCDCYSCATHIFYVGSVGEETQWHACVPQFARDKQVNGRASRTIQPYVAVRELSKNLFMLRGSLRLSTSLEL